MKNGKQVPQEVPQIKFGKLNIFIKKNCMVQPKYSPEEALQRVKLMMGYDSSKTLTENKQAAGLLKEAQLLNEIEPTTLVLIGAGIVAAGGAVYAQASNWFMDSAPDVEIIKTISKLCEGTVPTQYKELVSQLKKPSMSAQAHAKIADEINQGANYSFGTDEDKIYSAIDQIVASGSIGDWCAVRQAYNPQKPFELENLIIKDLDGYEQAVVGGKLKQILAKGKKKITTKDDTTQEPNYWIEKYGCLVTTKSFPEGWEDEIEQNRFGFTTVPVALKDKKGNIRNLNLQFDGKLFDGDRYIGWVLSCSGDNIQTKPSGKPVKESLIDEKKNLKEQGTTTIPGEADDTPPSPTPTPRIRREKPKPKYPPCQNGRYVLGCSSEVVRQVQECLGFMVVDQDGKFGKITQVALQKLGFAGGFTDKDVEKICKKVEEDPSLSVADSFGKPDINPGS